MAKMWEFEDILWLAGVCTVVVVAYFFYQYAVKMDKLERARRKVRAGEENPNSRSMRARARAAPRRRAGGPGG